MGQEEVQKGQEQLQELVRVPIQVRHLVRRQYDPRLWLVVVRVERAAPKLLQERGAEEQVQKDLRSLPLSRRDVCRRRLCGQRSAPTHVAQAASPLEATTCDIYTEGDGQCKTIAAAHRKVNLDDMKNVCGLARSAEAYIYAALI